jgi:hypothetical protein
VLATEPRATVDLPQTWDQASAQWDQTPGTWDPLPPGALFSGALRGTGVLQGTLVLGVVGLEGPLRGTGVLAGQLQTGVVVTGALLGTGVLVAPTLQTGALLQGALHGTGLLTGAFFIPPAGALLGGDLRGTGLLTGFMPGVALLLPHRFGPDSPTSQTPDLDANFNAILAEVNNPQLLGIGLLADRPAAGRAGALYVATDANDEWWMDDGVAWQTMGALGGGMVVHAPDNLRLFGVPAAGVGATHVIVAAVAAVIPTQSISDGAALYVADTQGVGGRAAWHHLSEAGERMPLDPVLFRDGVLVFNNDATVRTLWAHGPPTLRGQTLPGRYLEVWWHGEVVNNSGAVRTLSLSLYYSGTQCAGVQMPAIPISATPMPVSVLWRLDGLTGAVQGGLPVAVQAVGGWSGTGLTGTVDATLDQGLDLQAQFSAPHPGLELRTHAIAVTLR